MKRIRAAAFLTLLLFAIGAFAFQYSGSQPSSGQTGTPSQSTTQPSQTPSQSTTPPSQAAPSSQSAQPGEPGQAQKDSGQMPNIDNQVSMLTTQLNLTPDQQTKVRSVLVDQHEQAMNLVKDSSLSREDKMAKIHTLREGTIAKVREILTTDQKPKFDQMIQQQDERIKQHEQGANPAAPGSSPSGTSPSSTPPSGTPPSSTAPSTPPDSTTQPSNTPPSGVKPPQ